MTLRTITIVGGGLAGLSLGRALAARSLPVQLHEAGSYPRHKVCGEFIAGLTPRTRALLDLDPLLAPACRQHTVSWHRGGQTLCHWEPPEPVLALSRRQLDHALARSFVACGGELSTGSRFRLPGDPDGPASEGLVQATGRLPAAPRSRGPRWIGLKVHLMPPFGLHADLEVHLGNHAYVGLSKIEHGRVNLCGLFRRLPDLPKSGQPLLERYLAASGLQPLLQRMESAVMDENSRTAVAGLDFVRDSLPTRWMRLGDSRGMIPPFTGHGMAMAFESAAIALDPLTQFARGELSWKDTLEQVRQAHRKHFSGPLRHARRLHPLLYRPCPQRFIALAARARLLPMNPLYRLTHA